MKKIVNKKNIYILLLLVISLFGLAFSYTYAKFPSSYTTDDDIAGLNLNFDIGISNIEEYEVIEVLPGDYEVFNVEIKNSTSDNLYYGIWYRGTSLENVEIARLENTNTNTSGILNSEETKIVSIAVVNDSDISIKVDIGVASSIDGVANIEYLGGKKLITGTVMVNNKVNKPKLDDGNLIPVSYDKDNDSWVKVSTSNNDNTWYDYSNKLWANAVVINNLEKRELYLKADDGTVIDKDDILDVYVWIPRFKYRIFNVNRQSGDESTYSYLAVSNGIEVMFENGIDNTGNVECSYDINSLDNELFDKCYYKETKSEILGTDGNAWYTHPAFTFGDKEVEGFWVSKYEKSLAKDGVVSISEQFIKAKENQEYVSDKMDAHMINNLEWGAMVYLANSYYGICDISGCDLEDSSTTKNVTGIYNLNDSYKEVVMGNMVNEEGNFFVGSAEDKWNETKWYDTLNNSLNSKYYTSYAYGKDSSSYNRARLGDATGELSFINKNNNSFVGIGEAENVWFVRGNEDKDEDKSMFSFSGFNGSSEDIKYAYRVVIS